MKTIVDKNLEKDIVFKTGQENMKLDMSEAYWERFSSVFVTVFGEVIQSRGYPLSSTVLTMIQTNEAFNMEFLFFLRFAIKLVEQGALSFSVDKLSHEDVTEIGNTELPVEFANKVVGYFGGVTLADFIAFKTDKDTEKRMKESMIQIGLLHTIVSLMKKFEAPEELTIDEFLSRKNIKDLVLLQYIVLKELADGANPSQPKQIVGEKTPTIEDKNGLEKIIFDVGHMTRADAEKLSSSLL